MKNLYQEWQLTIAFLEIEDVITTSGGFAQEDVKSFDDDLVFEDIY